MISRVFFLGASVVLAAVFLLRLGVFVSDSVTRNQSCPSPVCQILPQPIDGDRYWTSDANKEINVCNTPHPQIQRGQNNLILQ